MKAGTIFRYFFAAAMGGFLSAIGFNLLTWQFWVGMLLQVCYGLACWAEERYG